MGVEVDQLAEGVDGRHHAGSGVGALEDGAVDLQDGLPGQAGQRAEQPAVEAEEDPQALGDGEDELAVGDGSADVTGDVVGDDQGPLLVAAGAEAAASAGERDEALVTAPRAADAGEALAQVAAGEELADRPSAR